MPTHFAIEAAGLSKSYGEVAVLTGVDFQVPRGSVFCLLGPNGAGKTTSVKILSTLVRPDSGTARVAGFDVVGHTAEVRRRISLTGQYAAVDGLQTGAENLIMIGRLLGLSARNARARATELLALFGLGDAARQRVSTYSGGMRRRLDLACGLVGRPEVIFLDEPTTGLDPRSRQDTWNIVAGLVAEGVSILLTTQYLEEADRLANRIALIDRGRVVAEGSPTELKTRVADQRLELTLVDEGAFDAAVLALASAILDKDPARRSVSVPTDGSAGHVRTLLDQLDPQRRLVATFALRTATLDDVFLALTGRSTTVDEKEPAHV